MKEFLEALKINILFQVVCWGIFILCDENKLMHQSSAVSLAINTSIIILLCIIILYFIYINKYIEKKNIKSIKFNIWLMFWWIITTIATMFYLLMLVDKKILHVCTGTGWSCLLNGFEYGIQGFLMLTLAAIIIIIKIIIMLYKHIRKGKNL